MSAYTAGILTVSDTAAADNSLDKSGPLLKDILTSTEKYIVIQQTIVPDEIHAIQKVIEQWTSSDSALNLVITTGGTGFSPRDITPEAIKPLLTRETPGITHLLLSTSLSITPFAALSRPITGIKNKTFIITLPGSPKACKENMEACLKALPHALDLLLDRSVKKLHEKIQQGQMDNNKPTDSVGGRHVCMHGHDKEGHESQTGQSDSLDTPVSRRARSSPYPLIPVDKALESIYNHAKVLNVISMPVSQFLTGHVLAEDVVSLEPVPGYRGSVVDGYAVHMEDGPGIYEIESISLASSSDESESKSLSRGKIARVATGGLVPDGANAVIMVEDTKLISSSEDDKEERQVEILVSASCEGENIRAIGSDCPVGQIVGKKGQLIGSELVGTFASVGIRHIKVYRKPRVGILSSGNEVLDHMHTDNLKPGQIRDTNRITLLATTIQQGFEAVDLGIVDDDVDEILERLEEALGKVDVLITTGGVSMGEADFMKPILQQKLDATIHFGRVLMKPGKPATFATVPYGGPKRPAKLVFALPGNPVSATVTFHIFVLPALRKLAGWSRYENTEVPVTIKHAIKLDSRPEFHRVVVKLNELGKLEAESTGKQQSSRMLSMMEANGLLRLPALQTPGLVQLEKGTTASCILIGNLK